MASSGASSSKANQNGKKDNLTYALKAKKAKEKELEIKRERGEISCAECKRCVSWIKFSQQSLC